MPNFEARFTAGASRAVWTDPADSTRPSRLNGLEVRPHTFREVIVGEPVTISAIVDGVVGPLDAALGGDTFSAWFAECPEWPAPSLSSPGGQSSVVTFAAEHAGHHLVVFLRSSGGRLLVPFWAIGT
jgi:hypothetical protein